MQLNSEQIIEMAWMQNLQAQAHILEINQTK